MNLLKAMQLFVSIVDRGSLTAAAEAGDLTPTMVGNHLRMLEEHLGMKLLNRTTRQQHLTQFGSGYYQRCVEILGLVADAETQASAARAEPQGRLRISVPHAFGLDRLMPALRDYLQRYPKVDLDVIFSDRLVDLLEDGFEAAIRIGDLPDAEVIAQPLQAHTLTLCAAPEYLLRRGHPAHPRDLAAHDCLTYLYAARGTGDSRALWRLRGADGEHALNVDSRVQLNNGPALREAALAGMGIALLPAVVVADDLATGRLLELFTEYQLPQRALHLLYLPDRRGSPKLRSFVEFMVQRFGKG